MIKKIVIFIIVVLFLIFGLKGINYARNQLTLKYVREEVNWIENYYSLNAHYPSDNEFIGKFSKIKLFISSTSYRSNSGSVNINSPQDYSLRYGLSKEITGAYGGPERETFGYNGHYLVKPCARSISGYYLNRFSTETYTNSDDWIYTDIYSGEVYSVHNSYMNDGKSNGKVPLLSGLIKPRIFLWVSPLNYINFDPSDLNNQDKYRNKVFITNGSDIFSYDWDSNNLKLINPQKIGEVPQSCSDSISSSENTDIIPKEEVVGTFKYDPNGPYPSPIVDKINIVNARGEVVDKWVNGTFKIIGTNETFEYREKYNPNPGDMTDYNGNAVNDCITLNCKFIYFSGKTSAIFNNIDDPAIGVIDKVTLYSEGKVVPATYVPSKLNDQAIYSITYTQSGKPGQVTTDTEDLCIGHKGGGFTCSAAPRYSKGNKVIFVHNPSYGPMYENRALSIDDTFKAELISYQYSTIPDTGEVFPVVKR